MATVAASVLATVLKKDWLHFCSEEFEIEYAVRGRRRPRPLRRGVQATPDNASEQQQQRGYLAPSHIQQSPVLERQADPFTCLEVTVEDLGCP